MLLSRRSLERSALVVSRRLIATRLAQTPASFLTLRQPSHLISKRLQSSQPSTTAQIKVDKPQMMIAFTCKKCDTRSSHVMSKQAYTSGTVLITCPGCKNRHLIADHLKIFSDDRITIQDILSAKGEGISQSTDDLVFDEIPKSLKKLIGHHAKDAPESVVNEVEKNDDEPSFLLEGEKEKR